MIITNCLLIRYRYGHVYVDRADGHARREQYVEMTGVRDRDHAAAIGREILALAAASRVTDARSGEVREIDQVPGIGYRLGDTIDGDLLAGVTVQLTGDGAVSIVHELNDSTLTRQAAMERRLARAAAGITGEWAAPNVDRQPEGTATDTTPPAFSLEQVAVAISPPWRVPRPFHLSWLEVQLDGPLLSRTRVITVVNGSSVGSPAALNAGDLRAVSVVNRSLHTGAVVQLVCTHAGAGTAGLTAALRGAMI